MSERFGNALRRAFFVGERVLVCFLDELAACHDPHGRERRARDGDDWESWWQGGEPDERDEDDRP